MNSASYWANRKAQEMFEYMAKAEDAADEIAKLYLKASRYLSLELDQIFERYRTKHGLSEAEARRLLNSLKDKTSVDGLKEALKSGKRDQAKAKASLLAELESPAYQARLERLQQLQNQLDITMQQVYKQEKIQNTSHYVDLANEAYYRSIFAVQQQTGLGFGFNLVSPKEIDRVINSRWSGANYSTRIWHNTNALAKDLKEELLINLVTGRTDREAADIIANKFGQGAGKARRLVRTESCNLANQMEMQSYEECGIETYIFVATLDLRTSEDCRGLDGKRFKVSEQQPGLNCPPMHPWCRSTTICNINDADLAQMQRRARDPVTGKTKTVDADMTYKQWYKEYVKGRPEAEANEKMIRNRSSDRRQYEKYKAVMENDAPKTLDAFQEMKYTDGEEWKQSQALYRKSNAYAKIIKEEPAITRDLKDVSEKIGIQMAGLEHRLKSKESFLRKAGKDSKHSLDPQAIKETIGSTNDVIRYTYQDNALSLVDSYGNIRCALEGKGYQLVRTKNFWLDKRNPYNGVNSVFQSPGGQKFEVQFHTSESFALKDGKEMHGLYEEARSEGISNARKNEVNAKMFELSSQLEVPLNIERIK